MAAHGPRPLTTPPPGDARRKRGASRRRGDPPSRWARPTLAKLTRPRLHAAYPRERLFQLLDGDVGLAAPVVWITGPPGAGKTTLAATWFEARRRPGIWYQLDSGDADPATFFYYLREAAQAARASAKHPLPLLTAEYQSDVPGFAHRWVRALFSRLPAGSVLALDNYHEVPTGSVLHSALAASFEEIPEGARIVVMSRTNPPPELARMVASERLVQIGSDALRLTAEEALGIASGKEPLTADQIRELHARSDGWAAGFTLLRERARRTGRVNRLDEAATMQQVFDYFMAQVFRELPETGRAALVTTSVLPRFTDAVAAELTGDPGAPEILEWLYRRHLFLERRYGDEITYQYHPLFRGFLRDQARASLTPAALAELSRRAATLLERSGTPEDSLQLLLDAGEHRRAAQLLQALAPALVAAGRGTLFREWLARVPDVEVDARPLLSYWLGTSLMGVSLPGARSAYERACAGFLRDRDRTGQAMAIAGSLQIFLLARDDDPSPTQRSLARVEALFAEPPAFPSSALAARVYGTLVGIMSLVAPSHPLLPTCVRRLEAALAEPLQDDDRVTAAGQLAEYYASAGFVHDAARIATATDPVARRASVSPLARTFWLIRTSWCSWAAGDFRTARANLEQALGIAAAQSRGPGGFYAAVLLAALALDFGEPSGVPALLERSPDLIPTYVSRAWSRKHGTAAVRFVEGNLAAIRGDLDEALRLVEQACSLLAPAMVSFRFNYVLGLVSVLVARGEIDRARTELEAIRQLYSPERFPVQAFRYAAIDAVVAAATGDRSRVAALRDGIRGLHALGVENPFVTQPLAARQVAELLVREGIELPWVRDWIRRTHMVPSSCDLVNWPWPLCARTLGSFRIEVDGVPLAFAGKVPRKPLQLLQAIIAFGGKDVRSEALCDALWPDSDGDTAQAALRMATSRLRKLLAHDAVVQHEGRVSLDERLWWVDLSAFRRACEAVRAGSPAGVAYILDLYRGPFLQDQREAPWILPARTHARRQLAEALATAAKALEAAGRADEAAALRRRLESRERGLE